MARDIETTIEIDSTPIVVWEVLVDFPAHREWNPFFASIDGVAEVGQTLTVVARKHESNEEGLGEGKGMTFRPTVLDVEPGRLLRWKGKFVIPGIFDGTHSFALEPIAGDRTRLVHSEHFAGILIPFMGSVLRDTKAGFEALNRALAQRVALQ